MRILLMANPISGAGEALAAARSLREQLRRAGHDADTVETQVAPPGAWLAPAIDGVDLLIVCGGDGAVRLASESVAASGAAIYHFPSGTENLFAREWGMSRDPGRLLEAIAANQVRKIDLGHANGEPFVLMASLGVDAAVVDDLTRHRRGAISHLTYTGPILRQFMRWQPTPLTITIDGKRIDRPMGMCVVGNSRQYGGRFDPALRADMSDGLLDVVAFPVRSKLDLLGWALAIRRRRHVRRAACVYERGRRIEIEAETPVHFQLDGDAPVAADEHGDRRVRKLTIDVQPGVIGVLVPPQMQK